MSKVILISIDGMRPDGLSTCKNEYVKELIKIVENKCPFYWTQNIVKYNKINFMMEEQLYAGTFKFYNK